MKKEVRNIAWKFRGRCRSQQDWEDMQQDVYVLYLEHRHKYDESKACLNTWCHNYLFKKVLTFVESAPQRNAKRLVPVEELPTQSTTQMSLDLRNAIKSLTKDEIRAITKYNPSLPHHRRGPFARYVKKIRTKLEEL